MLPSSALRCQYSLTGRAALLLRPDAICNLEAEDFSSQYRHLGRPPCSEPLLGGSLGASKARYSSVSTDTDPKDDQGTPTSSAAPSVPSTSASGNVPSTTQDGIFEYHGPFANAVKRVKGLSIASLGITVVGSPLLLALHGDPTMTLGAKAGIAGTLTGFGVFTTGLLHWFAAPYVHHLKYDRATGMIDVETMTFFLQQRFAQFHVSEVGPTDSLSPVSTFDAKGVTYYVDGDNFADKELLSKLAPPAEDPTTKDAASSAYDD